MKERALLLDPTQILPAELEGLLVRKGFTIERSTEGKDALKRISEAHYALVFYGIPGNDNSAIEMLKQLKSRALAPCAVLAAGPDSVAAAVAAMRAGAQHYWPVPLDLKEAEKSLEEGLLAPQPVSQRYQREGTLLQIIKEIALTMELEGLVNILMDSAMELTDADGGAILILEEKTKSLVMKAIRGLSGSESQAQYFGIPESTYYEVLEQKKAVLLHPDNPVSATDQLKISSIIIVPIWWKNEPQGVLATVKFAESEGNFTNDDFKLMSLLVDEISGAVYNAVTHHRTKELTIKDDLTDAYNRRYFEKYLDEEFMRARRYGSNLSLIFFDVDNLKEVNQQFGHLIGSKTLQEVAHRMILTVRGIDKVVRYGGDEFCVVLPETDTQGAYQVAERIRNTVASRPFVINDNVPVTITGSIGIASFPTHAETKEELVRQADKAMFVIKNRTKNAIAVAEALPG